MEAWDEGEGSEERHNASPIKLLYETFSEEEYRPKKRKADWIDGQCSVCGEEDTSVIEAGAFLGSTFGSWQELSRFNTISMLCKPCLWSFKDKRLLRSPIWVDQDSAEMLSWEEVGKKLLREDIDAKISVILPYGGRKIVAPYAQYGYVATDNGVLKWTPKYKKALAVCYQLHKVGIRGSLLSSPRVPFQQLSRCTEDKQKIIHDMWNYLRFIREDKTLLGLFVKLSMNMPKGDVQ